MKSAAECFIEKGFHQTSIRDIAHRAGISLGNLYNHFDSKAALIAEIAGLESKDIDDLEDQLSQHKDPATALGKFVSLYLAYCCQPENTTLSAEVVSEAIRNSDIGSSFTENRERLAQIVAELINRMPNASDRRQKIKASHSADFVLDLIEGLAMRCAFAKRTPSRSEINGLKRAVEHVTTP